MPPGRLSRHLFTVGIINDSDPTERLFLTSRVPFRFVNRRDNIQHIVSEGDTPWNLASRFYAPFPRPAGLWWVINDFQPQPIHDPTELLIPGSFIVLPSLRTVSEEIFSEDRRDL